MTITSRDDIQIKVLQKIGDLITKIVPVTEKLKKLASKHFGKLKPEITLKIHGVSVSLKLSQENDLKEGITEALISLDNLAKELNLRLVIVFDEFQEILRIDKNATLQGSIRHAVERAKQITYLFSGSNRPLRRMFNGKENPLYALCDVMTIDKIDADEYVSYMDKAATEKWGKPLRSDIIERILSYSGRYPKYINALCGAIWAIETKPTTDIVDKIWHSYILSKKTDIAEDLSELTLNQRRLLQWLCLHPTTELYSIEILASLKMSQSSVQKAILVLLEKDFVVKCNGVYTVLDNIFVNYFKIF